MSRLPTFIERVLRLSNLSPSLLSALVDDDATPAPAPGEPTPLRADPTTGALLTKDVGGGGSGGTVDQGAPGLDAWPVYDEDAALTYGTETPATDAKAQNVRVVGAQLMAVGPGVAPPGESAQSFYLIQAGSGEPVLDQDSIERLGVVLLKPIGSHVKADSVSVTLATDEELPLPTGAATEAKQGAGLPGALTAGGGVKIGLVDAIPTGGNVIGKTEMAASAQADGHSATIGATTDADTANTVIGRLQKIVSSLAGGLPAALGAGGGLKVDGSGSPLFVSNAAGAQADGHSATIGATTDTSSANTVVGRLQKLISLLPAALVGGRFSTDLGSWLGSVAPTVGVKAAADSIPVTIASDQGLFSVTAKGPIAPGAAVGSEKPVLFGGTDGTNAQLVNIDATGAVRLQSGGTPGATAPTRATQIGGTDGTNLRTLAVINTTPTTEYGAVTRNIPSGVQTVDIQEVSRTATGAVSAAQNGTIKTSSGKLLYLRAESDSAGTFYLQLHDASSTGGIGAGTIVGLGFTLSGAGDEIQFAIDGAPIEFTTGISWALSTTKNTYTAAAGKAAFVEARWR